HSGYCLRRHYTAFTGTKTGKNVQRFLESLVARQFAQKTTYRVDRGYVYHLHAWLRARSPQTRVITENSFA
ncbi:MAG TPA: hypothetical protein VIR54_30305, partial [Vicinamibacterales bacterium]